MAYRSPQTPRVRPLEPVQLPPESPGQSPNFLLRDRAGLTQEPIVVSLPALYLIELADGSRTFDQIAEQMQALTGLTVEEQQFNSLMNSLDQRYLLDNERARERLSEISPRPACHSGSGYPAEPGELAEFLDSILGRTADPEPAFSPASVLPHIDFFRGRESYQAGYRHLHGLARGEEPLTVVILGISHAFSSTPFILTQKDFDTPLGVVETDLDIVEQLGRKLPFDPFRDEYNHLSEHSVEFHAVVLKRLLRDRSFKIVPILCCSFHEAIRKSSSPLGLPGVAEFVKNLEALKSRENVHFLASVDLAHMGVQFGGRPLNRQFLSELERRDMESLAGMTEGDADGFFATHQADGGERNYCGTPAIYTLLKLFPEKFTLHRYQQCTDPDLGSTVTICAATLESNQTKTAALGRHPR